MPTLRDLVTAVQRRPGVAAALVVGRDGLLVEVAGMPPADAEALAALAPGLAAAAGMLGDAAGQGALTAAVLEYVGGLVAAITLPHDVLLVALLAADAEAGPVIQELRRSRGALGALV